MMKNINKRGQMYTWIVILITLFTVFVMYVVLDNTLKEHIIGMGRTDFGVNNTTLDYLETSWDAVPFVFFMSLAILGIMAALLSTGRPI